MMRGCKGFALAALVFLGGAAPVALAQGGPPGGMHGGMHGPGGMHGGPGHHWAAPPEAARRPNPVPFTADSVARGRALFATNCAVCHGPEGRGDGPGAGALNPKPNDLTRMGRHHPPGDFAWKIANGRGAMPAWKGVLSETQIWHLVNLIRAYAEPPPAVWAGETAVPSSRA